ncbi:flagellar hook-length control protein FliK [Paenibacillus nanensis]|uniref:Flagellar hook-length control protein FliK n=1 Tax=Paenibacillus nanensis TaxID=393251 RepID=A0A3A1UZN8_9BACL|nr:flagellar hook-length control protein FliK [Paenibacillus nanensis]RIX51823.1 flagellar hook-length control protein FliK [Paenibacillus nanensis]
MEMINSGVVSPGQAAAAKTVQGVKALAASEGEGGFRQVLVQQMSSEASPAAEQADGTGIAAVIAKLEAIASQTGNEAAPALEDLLSLIDGLVDQLEPLGQTEEALDGQLEELQSMLDALNALLALLGIPVPQTQPAVQADGDTDAAAAIHQVKAGLQDSLLQLQTAMQQGVFKQVKGQEPFALILNQLQSLASVLSEDTGTEEVKEKNASSQIPSWLTAQPSASKDAVQFLERLSQRTVHPLMINAAAAEMTNETNALQQVFSGEGAAVHSEDPAVIPAMTLITPDNVKEFASILGRKEAAPTTFVLAEDFAETMNGLIVQKFDVRTLNGASEARLMLFPEHMGQVDVRISMQNGVLTAVFQTDTAMAKDMLDNQMAQLRASLQAQGLNVEKLEVTHSPNASGLTQQHAGHGHQGGQSGNRQGFREDSKQVTDNAFETDMVEQAAIQGLGYGRAINETA